jgi:DNA-binding CsgD family transcriptional regulator
MKDEQHKIAALDLLHSLDGIHSIEQLEAGFRAVLADFGLTGFTFFQSFVIEGLPTINFLKGPADLQWHDHYWHQNYFPIDPCLPWAHKSRKPASWRDLNYLAETEKQKKLFAEAEEALGEGFIVPVHDHQSMGAFVLVGRDADLGARARPLLRILCYGFLERAEDLSEGYRLLEDSGLPLHQGHNITPVKGLTARQIECLHWVGAGKTDWAIGEILGLSESTVHRHVERAKARLGVGTRIQAVVAAQRARLLNF